MASRFTCKMTNSTESLVACFEQMENSGAYAGLPDSAKYAVTLALDELVSNVIKYGGSDPVELEFTLDSDSDSLHIVLRDDAPAFDPLAVPQPDETTDVDAMEIGGRGIFMVKNSVDEFVYLREDGRNVVELRLRFQP